MTFLSGLSYATQLDESVASFSSLVFHTVNVTRGNHPGLRKFSWRVTRPSLVRFGLLWKIFDLVGLRIPEFQVPILAPREADLGPCYLSYGVLSQSTDSD